MIKYKVYPYKQGSRSARALANALGGKVLRREGSSYVPRSNHVVVNWGSSSVPSFSPATTLNPDVSVALDKLKTFERLSEAGVSIPLFSSDKDLTKEWPKIVCRDTTTGHSGQGISIHNQGDEPPDAPLYVQYVKKKDEYRVHVVNGEPIFVQRKAKKHDCESPNWEVRTLAGGFSFVEVEWGDVPNDVTAQAWKAVQALGLTFGAVDVIWNELQQKAYVLEVNTACGLEQRTAEKYAEALKGLTDGS